MNRLEVGVLTKQTLLKHVLRNHDSLKILAPKLEQVIYFGIGTSASGVMINHLTMIGMLPKPVKASEVGFAAVIMDRYRPPAGVTVQSAGESLMSCGYTIDRATTLWVIDNLNELLKQCSGGLATLEQ